MKRRTVLLSMPTALFAAASYAASKKEGYERVMVAGDDKDMACNPASAYKHYCGEQDGQIFAHSCEDNFKPGDNCTAGSGYVQQCMPASAIKDGPPANPKGSG